MKLCLVGSTRFMDLYHEYNRRLTLAGHVVYTVAMVSTAERGADGPNIDVRDKEVLDLVHLRKILESEAVVVVTDASQYVGDSTRRELAWAQILGRTVFWNLNEVPRECYPDD